MLETLTPVTTTREVETNAAPQKVGYDESVSNLMFNEETGWMTEHTSTIMLWVIVLYLKKLLSCRSNLVPGTIIQLQHSKMGRGSLILENVGSEKEYEEIPLKTTFLGT